MFDIAQYTNATLRMNAHIRYQGHSADEVFNIIGDPERITEWYILAKAIKLHPKSKKENQTFNVEFTFFGDVFEEILHWDPPYRYVYLAKGDKFPIKDYVALIEIMENSPTSGLLCWKVYADIIEGEHFQRVLPVMLPAINEASMHRLSELIGGVECHVESFF